jgi:hypothetical protein
MKDFSRRIDRIEKVVGATQEKISEEERMKSFEQFKKEAPLWLKEIFAMFFHLMNEFANVESSRNPEKWRDAVEKNPNFSLMGNLSTYFWKEFSYIQEAVQKAIGTLSAEELAKVDRARVKAEFQRVVGKSNTLSDQTRDDFSKILGNPHKAYDNLLRRVWLLSPLEEEGGGCWKFRGGEWVYFDGNLPRWNGSEWVSNI